MQILPISFQLEGKTVLVVGGQAHLAPKLRLLARAKVAVQVVGTGIADELLDAARETGARIEARAPVPRDYHGAALAFVATGDAALDLEAARAARAARIPVNVVDRADLSDFAMPSIVDRGDVTVAVSTGGASPVLARLVRSRIESTLPPRIGNLARFAAQFRSAVKSVFGSTRERRLFWERVIEGPIGHAVLDGREIAAREQMLSLLNRPQPADDSRGIVYLVGAGPGDPELLTIKALRIMERADVVLYDDLVALEILDRVRREARRINVGKSRQGEAKTQDEINRLLLAYAVDGKRVLRLKGGDPFIFGRGGEELDYLRRLNVKTVVVPGITAALGCAAAAGIPLTHRDRASSVVFVAGHRRDGVDNVDWRALATPDNTIIVYMGLERAALVQERLLQAGLLASTPVAIIERGTTPEQRISYGTLDGLGRLADEHQHARPALLIIGDVVALGDGWAQHAPLREAVSW